MTVGFFVDVGKGKAEGTEPDPRPLQFGMVGKFQCVQADAVDHDAEEAQRDIEKVSEQNHEEEEYQAQNEKTFGKRIQKHDPHPVEVHGDIRPGQPHGKKTDVGDSSTSGVYLHARLSLDRC